LSAHLVGLPDNRKGVQVVRSGGTGFTLYGIYLVKRFCILIIPVVFTTDKFFMLLHGEAGQQNSTVFTCSHRVKQARKKVAEVFHPEPSQLP
jgi:hypothetical protein